jgi:membrane-associated phospholipid phosphatase
MVAAEIKPLADDAGFGHPSGHSIGSYCLFTFLLEEYILKRKLFLAQDEDAKKKNK